MIATKTIAHLHIMVSLSDSHSGSKDFFCEVCRQTMQLDQLPEHLIGKGHNIRKFKRGADKRGAYKGIVVPSGTQIIIEQNALWNDAVATYVLSLYKRGAVRSRL